MRYFIKVEFRKKRANACIEKSLLTSWYIRFFTIYFDILREKIPLSYYNIRTFSSQYQHVSFTAGRVWLRKEEINHVTYGSIVLCMEDYWCKITIINLHYPYLWLLCWFYFSNLSFFFCFSYRTLPFYHVHLKSLFFPVLLSLNFDSIVCSFLMNSWFVFIYMFVV